MRGRGEPTVEEYTDAFREHLNRQNELDIAYGKGRLHDPAETEDFSRRADEGQAEADRERMEQEERESGMARKVIGEAEADPENAGKSHADIVRGVAEKRADAKTDEIKRAPDAVQDGAFEGGVCIGIADEGGLLCRGGYIAVDKLGIMPNFKLGSDGETGVATPLKGDYRPDHDPIRVWRRADGSLMVISGRHRLDACRRAGVGSIMCYVYDESATRNEMWARRYDIEGNIRDNQASVAEVALYVRGWFTDGKALTDGQVERAGIAREGKAGSKGLRIGRRGTDAVLDALRNGKITDDEALAISDFCPGNEPVQRAGLAMVLAGEGKAATLARMEGELALQQAQAELGDGGGYDLFGNALGNDAFMDFAAKYVVRRRNALAKDASYLTTNVKRKNAAEMAKKYGVDIKDAEGMKKKLAQINMLRERWKTPYTDPELMAEMKEAYRSGLESGGGAAGSIPQSAGLRILEETYGRDGEGTVHFSAAGVDTLEAVRERWNRTLDDYYSGKLNGWRRPLLFGQTPAVLQMLGAPALKMTITRDVLDKVTRNKHHLDIGELRKLPDSMHEPLAVFRSNTQGDSMVVLTELHEEGKPAIVAVHINREQANIKVNKIASVYGKSGIMSLFQGVVLYADMPKIGKWTAMEGLQLPKIVESISRRHRILNPGDVVKWKNENNLPQVHFSIAGKKAKGYAAALDRGETYVDKADGCEKFVISTKGARLSGGFTMGMLNCPKGGHKDVSLPALLHFPELYRNYPELADIRVRVYTPKNDEPFLGFATVKNLMTGEAPYIGVNMALLRCFPNAEARLVETLLHESQHLIQHLEGHARGGGVESPEGAIKLLDKAIAKRKERGVGDDWNRDNLAWLEFLKHRVETTVDDLPMKHLLFEVYRSLRGEQEARWTGSKSDADGTKPMDAVEGLTGRAPGHETIFLDTPPEYSELGGVTYAGLGRWGYLLEERAPKGDFGYDRRLYQMMEAVRRRSRELRRQGGKDDGLKLAAEGLAVIDQINSLLPNQYKMALEPYKLYFNFYASLHGSGSPEHAAGVIPMKGWDVKMAGAMRKMAVELMARAKTYPQTQERERIAFLRRVWAEAAGLAWVS